MKRSPALAFTLALLVAGLTLARADDKADKAEKEKAQKELKAKRAALKKNLGEIVAADQGEDGSALDKAANLMGEVRQAESKDAAQALLKLATSLKHEQLFKAVKEELPRFQEEEPIKALALVLKPKDAKDVKKLPWQERALVAEAFGKLESPLTVEPLVFALEDHDVLVVNPAIVSAGTKKDKRVIPALIKVVGRFEKLGGWEYHRARQSLVELTGEDFFSEEKWKGWWDSKKDSFDFEKKGETKEAKTQEKSSEKKPEFFGTEVRSNRLLFVVDVSGSMQMTDPPDDPLDPEAVKKMAEQEPRVELQRIDRVRRELLKAIPNLDAKTQRFNILLFASNVRLWKEDLVEATDAVKKEACEFVKNAVKEGGGTYTDDALKKAFSLRDVDTFYFLSDGAPQKKVGNPGEQNLQFQRECIKACLDIVKLETRFRRVTINSFGLCGLGVWHKKWGPRSPLSTLDPKDVIPLREFMQEIAQITGGEFKPI